MSRDLFEGFYELNEDFSCQHNQKMNFFQTFSRPSTYDFAFADHYLSSNHSVSANPYYNPVNHDLASGDPYSPDIRAFPSAFPSFAHKEVASAIGNQPVPLYSSNSSCNMFSASNRSPSTLYSLPPLFTTEPLGTRPRYSPLATRKRKRSYARRWIWTNISLVEEWLEAGARYYSLRP